MQNLLSALQNASGVPYNSAAAVNVYKALCLSSYRMPVFRLEAMADDGSTVVMNLTSYFKSASVEFSNDLKAHMITYVLANPAGANGVAIFDKFGAGAGKDIFREDRIIRFRKGLKDPATGLEYFLPAHFGYVCNANPTYNPAGEQTISVTVADALKHLIKNKKTTIPYQNFNVNTIAANVLSRYAGIDPARISLAETSRVYSFVQFPDFPIADAMATLFEPLLFSFHADEAGNFVTRPLLGSPAYGANLMGYPDQTTEPAPALVAYTIPDISVESVSENWQDWDGVVNQVKVQGQSISSILSLGPITLLAEETDASIDRQGKKIEKITFQEGAGSGTNVVAQNAIVRLDYYTNADNPRVVCLSHLPFRGAWDANTSYAVGDGVEYESGGETVVYVCCSPALGVAQAPGNSIYWQSSGITKPYPIINGVSTALPWYKTVKIYNEDPHWVGEVFLDAVTPSYLVLRLEGRSYSKGQIATRKYGGFAYAISVYGQPQSAKSRTITAFADYNADLIVEDLSEPFGDHLTYQGSVQPWALGTPVEVFKDGVSLGKIAADGTILTGEQQFGVDWERGRITLKDLAYQTFAADSAASHIYSSGGTAESTTDTFSTNFLSPDVPQSVLQTRREGDSTYTFPGLTIGQSYDIRLTFADPTATKAQDRLFSVYAQGEKVLEGFDIYAKVNRRRAAFQEVLTGIAPDTDGKIMLVFTQHDPITGKDLEECKSSSNDDGSDPVLRGKAIVSAIEVLNPLGEAQAAEIAVNSGGAAYNPVPPTIAASYGYSPNQGRYQAQQLSIDNPLLASQEECQQMADWKCNRSQWGVNRFTVKTPHSVPHLQPGDLLKCYHPRIKKDIWLYLETIGRMLTAGSTEGNGGADSDTYTGFLIYLKPR